MVLGTYHWGPLMKQTVRPRHHHVTMFHLASHY